MSKSYSLSMLAVKIDISRLECTVLHKSPMQNNGRPRFETLLRQTLRTCSFAVLPRFAMQGFTVPVLLALSSFIKKLVIPASRVFIVADAKLLVTSMVGAVMHLYMS